MVEMSALLSEGGGVMTFAGAKRRFLVAHWEGGGNTPPMLAIVRRLVARGHEVRVLGSLISSPAVSIFSHLRAPPFIPTPNVPFIVPYTPLKTPNFGPCADRRHHVFGVFALPQLRVLFSLRKRPLERQHCRRQ